MSCQSRGLAHRPQAEAPTGWSHCRSPRPLPLLDEDSRIIDDVAHERYDRYDTFLTVTADTWIAALEPHASALLELPHHAPPPPVENAHAAAASLMAVLVVDALANRAAWMIRQLGPIAEVTGAPRLDVHPRSTLDFVCGLLDQSAPGEPTSDQLTEIYVLRDVLAHGHLWVATMGVSDDRLGYDILNATLADGFGDRRFRGASDGRVTKVLRLNLLPTSVDRRDAATVMRIASQTIEFLTSVPGASVYGSALRKISTRRGLLSLAEVAGFLKP